MPLKYGPDSQVIELLPRGMARRGERVRLRDYRLLTLQASFPGSPSLPSESGRAQDVAGVGPPSGARRSVIATTSRSPLLPRLPGIAGKAWGMAASWADHSDALSAHGRIWHQDGRTFCRAPGAGWTQE